ncbi:sulfatase [Streptomyces sp. DSM 41014]|uniref:Sulfatase n=1 Tax=Streptomyces hintoniae TaxID=3075521 RepID=A0ABU2UGW8_9ACTN|nr:sulfatase [Streptomyces sp. DSM 41014]MDT0472481.1 sulfatase [Streptomyces sp. DSM 41014]
MPHLKPPHRLPDTAPAPDTDTDRQVEPVPADTTGGDADRDEAKAATAAERKETEAIEAIEATGKTGAAAEPPAPAPAPVPEAQESPRTPQAPEPPEPAATTKPAEPTTPLTPPAPPASPASRPGWFGWRRGYPRAARYVTVGTTVLAAALVLFALLVPNRLDRLDVQSFLRIPAEGVLVAGLLLALPSRARRVTALVAGVLLGLLTVVKFVDMGFYSVLARPFDLVLDWSLLGGATDWVRESFGRTGEIAAVIGVIVLLVAVLVLTALAVVRLADLMVRHRPTAARTTLVLGTAWITCVTLGVQFTGVPIAAKLDADLVGNRVEQVRAGLADGRVFDRQAAVDAFADTPPDQLLTGLRGKDVLFTFIESYGRTAIDDPAMASDVDAVLKQGTSDLDAAGFASRSAWLRSPVTGAGSWLAHSTFLSGLWIKNQQRYRSLTTSDRATLTSYFQKTGAWRTVGIVPGVRRAWPEGKYFGLDHIYDSEHLGYQGPYFSWTPVPDQFSLEAFERLEHGTKDRDPIMAEIILASSHNPWAPVAHMIDWDDLGDGSVFERIKKEGKDPKEVWKDPESVRTEYKNAIEYSLHSLVEWVERYGDDRTVLVFLGDHQPVPTVTAGSTSRDVPITVVAHDPKVLDRIADWGWADGLKPADDGPQWGMDTFRDRFMTAFGSGAGN